MSRPTIKELQWQLEQSLLISTRVLYRLSARIPAFSQLINCSKNEGAEWGYYHTDYVIALHRVLEKLGCKSVIDLGCGLGLLMLQLDALWEYRVAGIENEKALVDGCLIRNVLHKDLLQLEKKDVLGYDALYMWEPIKDPEKCEKLVKRLINCMNKTQFLIYRAENGYGAITKSRAFKEIGGHCPFHVLQLKTN